MTTTSSDWVFQKSSGTYERPFASSEAVYGYLLHFCDSTGTYGGGVTFEISDIPRATVVSLVQEAICRYRFQAPIVACDRKVHQEQPLQQSLVYKPASSAEEAIAWAEQTLTVEASDHNLKKYLSQLAEMPLPYVHSDGREQYFGCTLVLHDKDMYSFICHVAHGFMDGRPFLNFLRFVLDTIVSPSKGECVHELEWGTEWENLPDSPGTLARRNVQLTDCEWNKGWEELQDKLGKVFDRKELGESLKPSNPLAGKNLMARAFHQIDEAGLTAIKNELKKIGLSMALLIPAAHMLTVFYENQPVSQDSYITIDLFMIDSARFFPQSHANPLMASSRTAFSPLIIEAKDIDWDTTIREQLICTMKLLNKQIQDYLRYPQLTLIDTAGPTKPDVAPMHPHTCVLSYIGVIDMILPPVIPEKPEDVKIRVIDFGVAHRHAGGFQRPSHIFWSFQGKFYILIQGSDHWDVKCFEDVLQKMANNMLQLPCSSS